MAADAHDQGMLMQDQGHARSASEEEGRGVVRFGLGPRVGG